jgi:hypothetical protein
VQIKPKINAYRKSSKKSVRIGTLQHGPYHCSWFSIALAASPGLQHEELHISRSHETTIPARRLPQALLVEAAATPPAIAQKQAILRRIGEGQSASAAALVFGETCACVLAGRMIPGCERSGHLCARKRDREAKRYALDSHSAGLASIVAQRMRGGAARERRECTNQGTHSP